jgi:hypothetical protein
MANLYEILAEAEGGEAMANLGRRFDLTPDENRGCGGSAAAGHFHGSQAIDGDT